jgi:hypothetical protein
MTARTKEPGTRLPTLEELLERRGIRKSAKFDDYQDYIEQEQRRGVRPGLINLPRIHVHGSMHLALGRIQSVKRFWSRGDKR